MNTRHSPGNIIYLDSFFPTFSFLQLFPCAFSMYNYQASESIEHMAHSKGNTVGGINLAFFQMIKNAVLKNNLRKQWADGTKKSLMSLASSKWNVIGASVSAANVRSPLNLLALNPASPDLPVPILSPPTKEKVEPVRLHTH